MMEICEEDDEMQMIDATKIKELVSMSDMIHAIETFFQNGEDEDVIMPERMHIADGDNVGLLMPSIFGDYYGIKLVGVAPKNADIGEPTLTGTYILHDRQTLKPLAIMDAPTLTSIRTGAISGVGMKYLAKDDASVVGVIGTGEQGWGHLQAAIAVRPIKTALIYNRSEARLQAFLKRAQATFPEITFRVAQPDDIVKQADIMITTTTSQEPVLPKVDQVDLTGKHVAGAGSFTEEMQEIPDYIIEQAEHIYVDTLTAFSECGEMQVAKRFGYTEDNTPTLKEMVKAGEQKDIKEKLTIFKSVGMAIYDSIAAKLIYEKAMKE